MCQLHARETCSQFFKAMWLGELSENTQHLPMSIAMLEEEIVDVNVKLNQALRQQFARTLSDVTMNLQCPE